MNKIFDVNKLGAIDLEGHILHPEADFRKTEYAFVGLGQGGGKLALEFNRVGYYVSLFNTAHEDLKDAKQKLEEIGNDNFKTTRFSGFDGAKKDRTIGLKAVHGNLDLIKSELLADKKLDEVDFVWVVAALGGGTGSGAVGDVVKIISSLIRNEENRIGYEDDGEYIISNGKPTVGVIAILPEDSSGHRIKLNAAEALQELSTLQDDGLLGSILLVDNEKLIKNAMQDTDSNIKWHVKGNASVVSLLTEITITSTMPAEESFDKSELLDIFSEPGYLAFSKYTFNHRNENDMKEIVDSSFKSQYYADGYDLDKSIISSVVVVSEKNSSLFTYHDELLLKNKVSELLTNAKYIHFGIYEAHSTQKYTDIIRTLSNKVQPSKLELAHIYTMSIVKTPPNRIFEMANSAIEKREAVANSFASIENDLESLDLGKAATIKRAKKEDASLESLISSRKKKASQTEKDNSLEFLLGGKQNA